MWIALTTKGQTAVKAKENTVLTIELAYAHCNTSTILLKNLQRKAWKLKLNLRSAHWRGQALHLAFEHNGRCNLDNLIRSCQNKSQDKKQTKISVEYKKIPSSLLFQLTGSSKSRVFFSLNSSVATLEISFSRSPDQVRFFHRLCQKL